MDCDVLELLLHNFFRRAASQAQFQIERNTAKTLSQESFSNFDATATSLHLSPVLLYKSKLLRHETIDTRHCAVRRSFSATRRSNGITVVLHACS